MSESVIFSRDDPDRGTDDAELAARIGRRDERAFEVLMRRHNRMLYRIARSVLKDDFEAEDALQDAYLAAYRAIGSFRGGARLSTWLSRIVLNEAYGRLRKRRPAAVVVPLATGEIGLEASMAVDSSPTPDTAAMHAQFRALVEQKIDELPEQFRTAFVLRDVEELSVDETAECLAIPAATVRSRAFRARALLRESLAREVDTATVSAFGFAGERCDRIVATVLARFQSLPEETR